MGFSGARQLAYAQDAGKYLYASFRKLPSLTMNAGYWVDLSMSSGNPAPNYYIGPQNTFTPLRQSTNGGLRHGGNVSPNKKFLRKLMVQTSIATPLPVAFKLMDYIGFYGFIDESILTEQFLDNTTPLPRYADGVGVQIMPVVVAAHTSNTQTFTVNYTNQDGVAGRVTNEARMSFQTVNGTILHSQQTSGAFVNNGPFLSLQGNDSGVRSIESVTIGGVGDVGLFALVLVKPIASISLYEITAASETDYLVDASSLPIIEDDAYLNFIALPNASLSGAQIFGIIETTWS